MKRSKYFPLLALAAAFNTSCIEMAHASTFPGAAGTIAPFSNKGHVYVATSFGVASTKMPTSPDFKAGESSNSLASSLSLGYTQQYNQSWDILGELSYNYFGSSSSSNTSKTSTTSIDLAEIGSYHLNNRWSIMGKGGMALLKANLQSNTKPSQKNEAIKPLVGIGALYRFNSQTSLQATYTHYFGDTHYSNGTSTVPVVSSFLLGLQYTFS
ncbi:outer membrane beta-barrel protein [Vibrio sp. S4M6]|uniref:outer membrane beta-barrel protein n=1 Tax=Vibrio sinus TaxID=2946865 RepID=UPI00202A9BC6|nr:outer membrane beta-barrel protein [Vibrio sinus]MCL9780649.1 outer membrane beta-barrel protein [Vibrio sinus]